MACCPAPEGPRALSIVAIRGAIAVVSALAALGAAGALGPARAQAQNPCVFDRGRHVRCLELQLFLPPANVGTTFGIDSPTLPPHMSLVLGLGASFASGVLTRQAGTLPDGTPLPQSDLVPSLAQVELLAAVGLFEFMEIGLALPMVVVSAPDAVGDLVMDPVPTMTSAGLGDARLSLKIPLVRGDFALAGRGVVTLPSGGTNDFSPRYWTLMPELVAAYGLGDVTLAGAFGLRLRRRVAVGNLEQDDELQLMLGGAYALSESFSFIGEVQYRFGVFGRSFEGNEMPGELDLGVRWAPTERITIDVGAGTGIINGYGAPTARGFAIVRYATSEEQCDAGPEDFDGYEDGDFCADPDNDGDGIEDSDDDCPNDPEDADGFMDADGCPDVDNDADGVRDAEDECPLESEDIDGYQDDDGCPEPDNDQDGILDGLDECRDDPEDRDGYQDDDGCPEPGPDRATVTVTDTRILISERIYFDFDRDTIRRVSQPLLDQVAEVIQSIPGRRRIRIEGYTDNEGDDEYNRDLSYRRARAVVIYLAGRGVPRRRLEFVGYGEANFVAPNDSPDGRALNRRVEFTILEPGERRVGQSDATRDVTRESRRESRRERRRERRERRRRGGMMRRGMRGMRGMN